MAAAIFARVSGLIVRAPFFGRLATLFRTSVALPAPAPLFPAQRACCAAAILAFVSAENGFRPRFPACAAGATDFDALFGGRPRRFAGSSEPSSTLTRPIPVDHPVP